MSLKYGKGYIVRDNRITFRLSKEETKLLNELIDISGYTRQEYFINNNLNPNIIIQGNPKVYKALKYKMDEIIKELKRIENSSELTHEYIEFMKIVLKVYDGMKEDF